MKFDPFDSAVIGIWLSGVFGVRFAWHLLFNPAGFPLYLAVAVVAWPAIYFLICGIRIFPAAYGVIDYLLLGTFSLFAILSCAFSPVPIFSIGYFAITIAGIYLAQLINTHLSDHTLAVSLKIYAILTTCLLLSLLFIEVSSHGELRLGRETDILNPNSIAMLAMSVAVAGLVFDRMFLLGLCQVVGLITIYLTGSRAAALGALIAIAVGLYHRLKSANNAVRFFAIFIMILVVPAFAIYNYEALYDFANSFFLWDDPHRGVRSGMSGRLYTWATMVDLIRDNWFIGVGFRAHGEFIKASSSHNGYLATMAEIGIFGFGAIFLFIVYRQANLLRHWYRKSSSPLINVLFAMSLGYLLIAVFERYLINVGNPVSLIFLIALFRLFPRRKKHEKEVSLATSEMG
jgi:O-antigen ligase